MQLIRDNFEDLQKFNHLSYDVIAEIIGKNYTANQLELNEQYRLLEKAISQLPQRKQLFCQYNFYDGLSINEVCGIMNMSVSNGHTMKHRIIKDLIKIVNELLHQKGA